MGRKRIDKRKARDVIVPVLEDVLSILAVTLTVGATVVIPATPLVITPIIRYLKDRKGKKEEELNHKYDRVRLWLLLRRLEKQKRVEINTMPDKSVEILLTKHGKAKFLRYRLEELGRTFNKEKWDGKWRIIIFDVPEKKRKSRNSFRRILKGLKFYQLQKSVYLTPFSCEEEIEFLREYHGLGNNVQSLITNSIENDQAYRLYFGLV